MLPPWRTRPESNNREERAELAHIAADPLAPPTEQDKEGGERKHEHDVDRAGQQVVPRQPQGNEPEDDAGSQKHHRKLGTGDDGGSILLPPPTTAKEQT